MGPRAARWLVGVAITGLIASTAGGCSSGGNDEPASRMGPTPEQLAKGARSLFDDVDPFIGTAAASLKVEQPVPLGAGGDVFPGAAMPFGAVQWSPDTPHAEVPAGYHFGDTAITHFSLTHFSGAGCPNNGLFGFLPTTGPDRIEPAAFQHQHERAVPGSYEVDLDDHIAVKLAATLRGGFATFDFPPGTRPTVVVSTSRDGLTSDGYLKAVSPTILEGKEINGRFCGAPDGYPVFLRAEFSAPFRLKPGPKNGTSILEFGSDQSATTTRTVLTVRVAISSVDPAGAGKNLASEFPSAERTYADYRHDAEASWRDLFDRLQVAGGTQAQRRILATALYHSLLHPNVFSDADGRYLGFDHAIHAVPAGHLRYHTFSGWDIYRSQVQLIAMLAPSVAADLEASLLDHAQQCRGGFDQWTMGNVETHVMIGDPGAQMVANLDAFAARGAPPEQVLPVLRRSALEPATACDGQPLRPGLAHYLERGWVDGDVSRTLEYAMADAAIASYAQRHGDRELAATARQHARNWETQFNRHNGYAQPRTGDGRWAAWFGPSERTGYTEGNSAQYTWMVPQGYRRLVVLLGGRAQATRRLDELFSRVDAGLSEPHFYMGNEPMFPVPWAYAWTGRPDRTTDAVRKILRETFDTSPGGLPGNDDLGATSSWIVWASIGMFPVVPGQDVLVLHTPAFRAVRIAVPHRRLVLITAAGKPDSGYITGAELGGQPLDRAWVRFTDLREAGSLAFTTASKPATWATTQAADPPSLGR